ncbi:MAG: mandelate racemase/muconate lactonizing enzyme family protein [Micromonosporaceae bacterium]
MKVSSVDSFVVSAAPRRPYWGARAWGEEPPPGAYPPQFRRRYLYSPTIDAVLVRIRTEDGVEGWGEAKAPVAAHATATLVDQLLAPLVVGTRLDEITATWDRMYAGMRVRGHDSGFWLEAIAGVDIALWDAWSRHCGQPMYAMLGGRCRTSVAVYASGVPAGPDPGAVRAEAQLLREAGHLAVKVAIGTDPATDLASVTAVREVFDHVLADAAGQYDLSQALRVGRGLTDLGAGFFEMPLPPEDIDGYARLAAALDIPLALDSIATRHRAVQFLRAGALRVVQPDVCRAGGITETMRIAVVADAFGAQATPHVSIGSPVHLAASLHCAAAIPNLAWLEWWVGDNPLARLCPHPPAPRQGRVTVPAEPGLGVTVDPAALDELEAR